MIKINIISKNKVSLFILTIIILNFFTFPVECGLNDKKSIVRNKTTFTLTDENLISVKMEYEFNLNEKIINEIKEKYGINVHNSFPCVYLLSNSIPTEDSYMPAWIGIPTELNRNIEIAPLENIIEFDFAFTNPFREIAKEFDEDLFSDVFYQYEVRVCSQLDEWNGYIWALGTKLISNCEVYSSPLYRLGDLPKIYKIQYNTSKITMFNQTYSISPPEEKGMIIQNFDIELEILHNKFFLKIESPTKIEYLMNITLILENGEKPCHFKENLRGLEDVLESEECGWSYDDETNFIIIACSEFEIIKNIDINYERKFLKSKICKTIDLYHYATELDVSSSSSYKKDLDVIINLNDYHYKSSDPEPNDISENQLLYSFKEPKTIKLEYVGKEKSQLDLIKNISIFLLPPIIILVFLLIFLRKIKWISLISFFSLVLSIFIPSRLSIFYELSFKEFILYTKLFYSIVICIVFCVIVLVTSFVRRRREEDERRREEDKRTCATGIR